MKIWKHSKIVRNVVCFSALIVGAAGATEIPNWWYTRGVVNTQEVANDFSAANLGQLKHVAYQTWVEMTNQLAQITTLTNEMDPLFTASAAVGITTNDINHWNSAPTNLPSGDAHSLGPY